MTNWIDDLFGGRDKEYPHTDGTRRISQRDDDKAKSQERGDDYPRYTRDSDDNWHRSEDGKTHSSSWNLFGSNDSNDSEDDSGSSEEGNSWNLFG